MSLSKNQTNDSVSIHAPMAYIDFSMLFMKYLNQHYTSPYKELVFLCIGTDRSTGDSLGPLIGYKLIPHLNKYQDIHVHGTLDEPVHAKNLKEKIKLLQDIYDNPLIVAIDACLGKTERIGFVKVGSGPLKPGAGVNKDLPAVGHLHITGIVNLSGYMEYLVLQNTRLSLVMKMAETIADGIKFSVWKLNQQKKLLI